MVLLTQVGPDLAARQRQRIHPLVRVALHSFGIPPTRRVQYLCQDLNIVMGKNKYILVKYTISNTHIVRFTHRIGFDEGRAHGLVDEAAQLAAHQLKLRVVVLDQRMRIMRSHLQKFWLNFRQNLKFTNIVTQ